MPTPIDPFSCPSCGQTFYPGEGRAPPRIVRVLRAIRRWWRDSRVEPGEPPKPAPLPPPVKLPTIAEAREGTRLLYAPPPPGEKVRAWLDRTHD